MKILRESFLERAIKDLIILIMYVIISTVVTFLTFIIFNIPVTLYIGQFNWDFENYVTLVLGLSLGLILIDKVRIWVSRQ